MFSLGVPSWENIKRFGNGEFLYQRVRSTDRSIEKRENVDFCFQRLRVHVDVGGVHVELPHEQVPVFVVRRRKDVQAVAAQRRIERKQHRLDGDAGRLTTVHRRGVDEVGDIEVRQKIVVHKFWYVS